MAEEKTEKKEDLKKQLDSIAYELRQLHDKVERHSRNWVKAANTIMGDVGGKPGEAKHGKSIISVLIATAVTLLLAGSVFATVTLIDWTTGDSADNGTAYITSDEAGTATLTVDAAAVATVTVTTFGVTTLNVSGDVNASGNILGDDATIISNISIIAVDTIMSDGASLTIGDGTETLAIDSSLVDLSTLGALSGVLSVTLTNGTSIVATDADTVTITETSVAIVGALDVTGNVTAGNLTTSTQAIDINSVASNDYIRLDQTNATGVPSAPYMAITDARTGTYANEAAEATLVITPSGSYAISVASGISAFAGDIAANGNITGDDATIITNISIIAVDTIMSDGASLTLGDGTETIAINSSLTDLSALGAFTGVLSIGLTNGASIVATDGDTLTITETTIDLVGATVVDGLTASGTLDFPAQSIGSDDLAASLTDSTLVSNATLEVVGAIASFSTSVYAPKVYITADDYFQEIGTTLVFVANSGAATNVLDPDITTP